MDTNAVTEEMKKQIYEMLCDDLIRGLDRGDMTTSDSEESCAFIVEQLDTVMTKNDVLFFLQALSTRWPSYQAAYISIRSNILQIEDQNKAKDIAKEIQKLNNTL